MYVNSVTIFVKPECVAAFIAATLDNARNTRLEPGNLRFDVMQAEGDPTRFGLYEAYKHKDDLGQHYKTAHYLRWKQTVESFMARPREAAKYETLFFGDE